MSDRATQAVDRDGERVPAGGTDEQFRALLEGLRTSIPGVQVLFAFLLTAPLQSGFAEVTLNQRTAFSIAFYSSGLASILLISPSVHQRLRAPVSGIPRRSESHLSIAIWVTIVGTVAMGVAMLSTVYLVSALVFGPTTALVATVLLTSALLWSWFHLPLVTFPRVDDQS